MTIEELTTLLTETLGDNIPVFFHHVFIDDDDDDAEIPPVYVVTESIGVNPFRADNINYYMSYINTVTVCAASFREDLLATIEGVFNSAGVPFERETEYDDDTLLFSTIYEVNLDN